VSPNYALDFLFGRRAQRDPRVLQALKSIYPDGVLEWATKEEDRKGIDAWLIRPWGRLPVQIKASRNAYRGDLIVELWSDYERGIPGWTINPPAELLVQLWPDTFGVFHLPTIAAFTRANFDRLMDTAFVKRNTYRDGTPYTSYAVPVPIAGLPGVLIAPE